MHFNLSRCTTETEAQNLSATFSQKMAEIFRLHLNPVVNVLIAFSAILAKIFAIFFKKTVLL
jgi:hypothetical protein